MDVGERGRNKVAQLKNMLDVKAQQNRNSPVTTLNPPKVNKYLSKEYNAMYKVSTHFVRFFIIPMKIYHITHRID